MLKNRERAQYTQGFPDRLNKKKNQTNKVRIIIFPKELERKNAG